MLPSLLIGLFVLGVVLYFLRWYGNAKTEDIKKSLRWTGIGLGLLLVLLLAVTGRLGVAVAFLMGLGAWAWRVFNMIQMGQQMAGLFRGMGRKASAKGGHNASQVQSTFLNMTLDHDTGHLDGEVIQGGFAGRKLSDLAFEDLMTLLLETRRDPESLALMESFLDRSHPDWRARDHEAGARGTNVSPSSAMTEDEALQILGLAKGASSEEVKSAYRRLMTQLHPDRGGSDYLAAKINAAKDLLLKD